MTGSVSVSIIVPFFEAERYIRRSLDVSLKQRFSLPYEVIMVNDGSTDNSYSIVQSYKSPTLKLLSLPSNSGPAAARNAGLKVAEGEYIFFLDVDDTITTDTLRILCDAAYDTGCDVVFSDKSRIENSKDQTAGIFLYPSDRTLESSDLEQAMRLRYYDPITTVGLFGLTGRLIKRSLIIENNVLFEENLRYWEDETFNWDLFGYIRSARYIRKKLYSYFVNPQVGSGVSAGFSKGFPVSNFKLTKSRIQNTLRERGFSDDEITKIGNQALIYFIISAMVSYSRSMILGKTNFEQGVKTRRKIIDEIFADKDVSIAIKGYRPSGSENPWIPRAIAWKSRKLFEIACNRRAKDVLLLRRSGKA